MAGKAETIVEYLVRAGREPEGGLRFVDGDERATWIGWGEVRAQAEAVARRLAALGFAPGERALLEQTLSLLALARSSPHEAERRGAYERARRRLADLERRTGWALPRPAGELLAARARGMLPASAA